MQTKVMTFSVTVAANQTVTNAITTQDDNQDRTVTGIWATDETKLVQTFLQLQGKNFVEYDDFLNSLLKDFLGCSVVFPSGIQIVLGAFNGTGGAVGPYNVSIRYTVNN